jgi:ferritin-like metal-binding protein YciE
MATPVSRPTQSPSNEEDDAMTTAEKKLVQYLEEARATELALVRDLQSQIALTPHGSYRTLLEQHLGQTREHAARVYERMRDLDRGFDPLRMVGSAAQAVVAQALALGKMPLELVRGSSGEEKVLKNARDAYAAEALEIATYTAIERLANDVGDDKTAKLAESIRRDEEQMLDGIEQELPKLADAVVRAQVDGNGSYDISETGAADAVRESASEAKQAARKTATRARRTAAREAHRVPGAARAEGEVKGALASEEDLPIPGYDELTADEIVARLAELSQVDLAKIEAYERKHQQRATVLNKVASVRADEPWPGYDEQTVDEISERLRDADEALVQKVREYERAHKNRATVINATERRLAGVS